MEKPKLIKNAKCYNGQCTFECPICPFMDINVFKDTWKGIDKELAKSEYLTIKKDNNETTYKIGGYEWNWSLKRYTPKAVKVITIEHLNRKPRKSKN